MAEYVMKCMPFMNEYTKEDVEKTNTDNIFNVKETTGLKRKDIFTEYLIEVENKISRDHVNIALEVCDTCGEDSNILHFHETADLVCDGCGQNCTCDEWRTHVSWRTRDVGKVVNYSYKKENHFNEWLSQFQARKWPPTRRREQLRSDSRKSKSRNSKTSHMLKLEDYSRNSD